MYLQTIQADSGAPWTITPLWRAGSPGTRLRIQNRSCCILEVLIFLSDDPTDFLTWDLLPRRTVDQNYVDPGLAVAVRSTAPNVAFSAVRLP